jgi:hypothetical protein
MRPGTSAGSGSGGNGNGGRTSGGLLSQQMSSSIPVEPPPRPPSAAGSGHGCTPPVYISGHGPGGGGNGGSRSGAATPEDAPSTRNGSKPASPKALEAQVAKLVQGQQMLSNQLEELALQISLAQSGLGAVVPRALQLQQQAAAESQLQRPGLWQQLCGLGGGGDGSGSLPPAAWAAVGALAGTAATLLLMQARQ